MTPYDVYKLSMLDYMKHGDDFNTAHGLACMNGTVLVDVASVYKSRLQKEIKENI